MEKWDFLNKWRCELVRFAEIVYLRRDPDSIFEDVSLRQTVCRVDVDFLRLERQYVHTQGYPLWLREALELVGLALHYDKQAWKWLRDFDESDFDEPDFDEPDFDVDTLEPLFEFRFHDGRCGDLGHRVHNGIEVLLYHGDLSAEYHQAKQQLEAIVGEQFDPTYRVPVSLLLVPDLYIRNREAWCDTVVQFARTTRSKVTWFDFQHMRLFIWPLLVDNTIVKLLSDLLDAKIPMPQVTFKFEHNPTVHSNDYINASVVDVAQVVNITANNADTLVQNLNMMECNVRSFVQACSSFRQAKSPSKLELYDAFERTDEDRAIKWRWLGYALSGPTSIRGLAICADRLTLADMRRFTGAVVPRGTPDADPMHCVQLATGACIRFSDSSEFITVNGFSKDATYPVLDVGRRELTIIVPGYGLCKVDRALVIREMPPSEQRLNLESLHCRIDCISFDAVLLLSRSIGSSLVHLTMSVVYEIFLSREEVVAFASAFPKLTFLRLKKIHLGSFDPMIEAYNTGMCIVSVLSMIDSSVSTDSMTRFAEQLALPESRLAKTLCEFEYKCEGDIINEQAAAMFETALAVNQVLFVIDINLALPIYEMFGSQLHRFHNQRLLNSRYALLSVYGKIPSTPKRPRLTMPVLPILDQVLSNMIFSYLPIVKREVTVTLIGKNGPYRTQRRLRWCKLPSPV